MNSAVASRRFWLLLSFGWASILALVRTAGAAPAFPSISLKFFNPTTISTQAWSYQMADYDAARNQVLFYPYGSLDISTGTMGTLISFNVSAGTQNFATGGDWTSVDLTRFGGPNAVNFGGGLLDPSDTYAYLPSRSFNGTSLAAKINLAAMAANPNDPAAYSFFDPRTIPGTPSAGGFSGVYADGFVYFAPTHSNALARYDSSQAFTSAAAWQALDLSTIQSGLGGGSQSIAYVAPYVYVIPFVTPGGNGLSSQLIRYDTRQDFLSTSSYQVFDLTQLAASPDNVVPSNLQAQLGGFTGYVVVGTRLVLNPWGASGAGSNKNPITNYVALMFDTTKQLDDPTAWQYIDLRTVNPNAGGYQFAWLDRDGFVFFIPTHNYNMTTTPAVPPFVAWNTGLPFNVSSSWTSYSDQPLSWSTGAGYDPATDTAWLSSYGSVTAGTPLTQVQETYAYSAPSIASVTPSSAAAGSADLVVTVSGAGFAARSTVQWDGLNLATIFDTPTQLTATIPASDLASAGTGSLEVVNPSPGGGASNASTFAVTTVTSAEITPVIRVYPNPWRSDGGTGQIWFDGLPAGSTVKIFTLAGHWVRTLTTGGSSVSWDLANDSGRKVASGLYIYLVTDPSGNKTRGKLTVIK
ncbi:MAG TPA: T9SS type A sorting domain-containing protein [Elusimicrobiota bacterium]|nr:T9SS type A sorting domain-containing protein [Elusimicrobiota bacterium]